MAFSGGFKNRNRNRNKNKTDLYKPLLFFCLIKILIRERIREM